LRGWADNANLHRAHTLSGANGGQTFGGGAFPVGLWPPTPTRRSVPIHTEKDSALSDTMTHIIKWLTSSRTLSIASRRRENWLSITVSVRCRRGWVLLHRNCSCCRRHFMPRDSHVNWYCCCCSQPAAR